MEGKKTKKVTRKFLLGLADRIYDTETRRFLRLCSGTLQNGPDPTDGERTMHCGLGELYFAMTGRQPKADGMCDDDDVVEKAVELSILGQSADAVRGRAQKAIKDLGLPSGVEKHVLGSLNNIDDDDLTAQAEFRDILESIPRVNDGARDSKGNNESYSAYRSRSARVARKLREAAALLPSG